MDTREKIVSLHELPGLLANGNWEIIVGLFDPLTLLQAERVAAVAKSGRKILTVVIPGQATLLAAEARAALLAALRDVAAVVIAEPGQVRLDGTIVHEDPAAEQRRSAEFVGFVLERQRSTPVKTGLQQS